MMKLSGVISDRIRKLFPASDPAWNPGRPASPTVSTPVPTHVQGTPMTGRHRKAK